VAVALACVPDLFGLSCQPLWSVFVMSMTMEVGKTAQTDLQFTVQSLCIFTERPSTAWHVNQISTCRFFFALVRIVPDVGLQMLVAVLAQWAKGLVLCLYDAAVCHEAGSLGLWTDWLCSVGLRQ
jgi:hypothetical protein